MPERQKQNFELKQFINKRFVFAIVSFGLIFGPQKGVSQTQNYDLPSRCFQSDGLVDTKVCFSELLHSPYMYQILAPGWHDNFGLTQDDLPNQNEHNFHPGDYIIGNLLIMSDFYLKDIDPEIPGVIGVMATDSCYPKINRMIAYVRPLYSKVAFSGKFEITDCASSFDQDGRNTILASAGEINEAQFKMFQDGGLFAAEIVLMPYYDNTIPDPNMDIRNAVNYPKAYCEIRQNYCPLVDELAIPSSPTP